MKKVKSEENAGGQGQGIGRSSWIGMSQYVIKEIPEDFIVDEIMDRAFSQGMLQYIILKVTKRDRTTEDVAKDIADCLNVRRREVGMCGNKDRHAVTTQYFSVRTLLRPDAVQKRVSRVKGVICEIAGYHEDALHLGDHAGNAFRITVRGLSPEVGVRCARMNPKTTGKGDGENGVVLPQIPNYFDEQRFSENNIEAGRAIVKGEFRKACKLITGDDSANPIPLLRSVPQGTLRLTIHAYQAYIWNETAKELIRKPYDEVSYHLGSDSQGIFRFPRGTGLNTKIQVPLVGFGLESARKRLDSIISKIMARECITPRNFIIRSLPDISSEGGLRDLFMSVADLTAGRLEDDDLHTGKKKLLLSFTLPKGSYATIVVKALFL